MTHHTTWRSVSVTAAFLLTTALISAPAQARRKPGSIDDSAVVLTRALAVQLRLAPPPKTYP
jgi:hypothetical protein